MDFKVIFSLIATAIGVAAFIPYLKNTLSRSTKPHPYTWLIWAITQGTAVAAIWYGGGGWGALNPAAGTVLAAVVFIFSIKFGAKNITQSDTVTLIAALSAIVVWWQLEQPLLSVIMVTAIDLIGYVPSFRKSYQEPWSEHLTTWIAFCFANIFSLLALREYNLLTTMFLIASTNANILLLLFCLSRRRFIAKPQPEQ